MRASMLLRSAAKGKKKGIPIEVYPLLASMGLVPIYAGYRLISNYSQDEVRSGHQSQNTSRLPESGGH